MFLFVRPWPLIGSLHLLGRFKRVPFEAFTALQKVEFSRNGTTGCESLSQSLNVKILLFQEYGRVVQLRMGSLNAVVVSEGPDVKEVLHTKVSSHCRGPSYGRELLSELIKKDIIFVNASNMKKKKKYA